MAGGLDEVRFRVLSNPNHAMIPCFYDFPAYAFQWDTKIFFMWFHYILLSLPPSHLFFLNNLIFHDYFDVAFPCFLWKSALSSNGLAFVAFLYSFYIKWNKDERQKRTPCHKLTWDQRYGMWFCLLYFKLSETRVGLDCVQTQMQGLRVTIRGSWTSLQC